MAVAAFGTNLPPSLAARVLAVQGMIGVGFLAFIIFTSNPFARLDPAPLDGNGLNPLLQDPGLASHPPFLYLGYVGFSMAFSFAVAALIEGKVDPAWARWVRPWTLAAWCFLTIGIMLGSLWAYYELGWGGWWFWDPVENASLMPWLAGTALVHSAHRRREARRLEALDDPARDPDVLAQPDRDIPRALRRDHQRARLRHRSRRAACLFWVCCWRRPAARSRSTRSARPTLKLGNLFAPVSRETSLILNNVFLVSITGVVFIGTFYPLVRLDDERRPHLRRPAVLQSVLRAGDAGADGRNGRRSVLELEARQPARGDDAHARGRGRGTRRGRLGVVAQLGARSFAAAGLAAATWLLREFADRRGSTPRHRKRLVSTMWQRAKGLPRSVYGLVVAHAGIAIVAAGIAGVSSWQSETVTQLNAGQTAEGRRRTKSA